MNRIETSPTLDDSAAIAKLHARTAQRASVTYTAATLIIALMSLESAITSRTSDWQPFAAALVAISLSVTGGVAFRQIRRGSYLRGAHLIIGSFLMGLILFTTLHTGFGLVIALSGIAITVGIGGQTLPARQVGRTVVLAVLDAAIIILIDLYWPFYRSPAPRVFLQFIPVVGVVVIIYFVYTLIRQFQSYPLQTKLLLAFFLVALVPLGILTESNDNATRLALTSSANQALSAAAAQTADSIDNFFASNIAALKVDAQLPTIIDFLNLPPETRTAGSVFERTTSDLLVTLSRAGAQPNAAPTSADESGSYFLLDITGQVVASEDRSLVTQVASLYDYFKAPLQTGEVYVSPIQFSQPTEVPSLYLSMVVEDSSMQPIGVLVVHYRAGALQQIAAGRNGIAGPGSFPVVFDVIDNNYIRLAHGTAPDAIGKAVGPLDPIEARQIQAAHRLPSGALTNLSTNLTGLEQQLSNAANQPFFAAQDVATGDQINQVAVTAVKSEPWLVAVFQPQDIFLQPAEQQTQNTIKLALALSVLVAAAAVGVAQLLTGPIVRLSAVIARTTAGDLSARARVETSDEIGALADGVNKMTVQLEDLIGSLEKRVEARTEQLRASAEVGRAAASILDPESLLAEVVNLITDRFGFYYAAIFLIDENGRHAVLQAATGEAGRTLKERQHKLEIGGQSMVSGAITAQRPRIALDVGTEPVRFANPLLPETRSEIALPLMVGDRTLGALDVQSTEAAAFDETYASVLQSMADEIAIALSNTQQFSRTESALRQTNILYEAGRKIAAADSAKEILAALITHAAPDADHGAVITFGPVDAFSEVSYLELAAMYSTDSAEFHLIVGTHYRLEQLPIVNTTTPAQEPLIVEDYETSDPGTKQALSLLGAKAVVSLPLVAGNKRLGTLVLGYRAPRSFSRESLQVLQALSNQAAVALQDRQLLAETQAALKQLDAINRRLTGQAWRDYTQAHGAVQAVNAGPGVPATISSEWLESTIDIDLVQATGPIGDARSALIAPIALRGKVIGALSLQEIDKDREWTENEIALLQTVANDVAVAIENARLIEKTEQRAEHERVITEISSRMFAANDLHDIVKVAGDELARILHVARAEVQIGGEYLAASMSDSDSTHEHNGH